MQGAASLSLGVSDDTTQGCAYRLKKQTGDFEIDKTKNDTDLTFNLFLPFTFKYGVTAIEQELPKVIDFMAFPVLDTVLQVRDGANA